MSAAPELPAAARLPVLSAARRAPAVASETAPLLRVLVHRRFGMSSCEWPGRPSPLLQ